MKPTKQSKSAEMEVPEATGRHGAVDFAATSELLERSARVDAAGAEHHIYRVIELVGSSERSIEDAIKTAIQRADKTLRNLRWFEVVRTSGHISGGNASHFQVTLKVGFTMEEAF